MEGNRLCSLCHSKPADHVCICFNLPVFCSNCSFQHVSKPDFHFLLPVEALNYVNLENQHLYSLWLYGLSNSHRKLRASIAKIDQFMSEIDGVFDHLHSELVHLQAEHVQNLAALKSALVLLIEESITETSTFAYQSACTSPNYLSNLIWTHTASQSGDTLLRLECEANVHFEGIKDSIGVQCRVITGEHVWTTYGNKGRNFKEEIEDLKEKITEMTGNLKEKEDEISGWQRELQTQRNLYDLLQSEIREKDAFFLSKIHENEDVIRANCAEIDRLKSELSLHFDTEADKKPVQTSTDDGLQLTLEESKTDIVRSDLVHVNAKKGEVGVFSLMSMRWNRGKLVGKVDGLNRDSRYVWVDSGLLCSGGCLGSQVSYLLVGGEEWVARRLTDMVLPRSGHGQWWDVLRRKVLTFGGLKGCEVRSFPVDTVAPITEMNKSRSDFNPCCFHGFVYLCGGWTPSIEAFSPESCLFTLLQVDLTDEFSHSITFVDQSELVVMSGTHVTRWKAASGPQLSLTALTKHKYADLRCNMEPAVTSAWVYTVQGNKVLRITKEAVQQKQVSDLREEQPQDTCAAW